MQEKPSLLNYSISETENDLRHGPFLFLLLLLSLPVPLWSGKQERKQRKTGTPRREPVAVSLTPSTPTLGPRPDQDEKHAPQRASRPRGYPNPHGDLGYDPHIRWHYQLALWEYPSQARSHANLFTPHQETRPPISPVLSDVIPETESDSMAGVPMTTDSNSCCPQP